MSARLEPIKIWGLGKTANPLKVAIILEELGLPYESVPVAISDVKKPEYTAINPNGRLPSIHDPNTRITLWESGAILEYLIETYDTNRQLSFAPGISEFWHARQWLYFQTTGQGPYYGQAGWFKLFHQEKIPSAIKRYIEEVNRVSSVLEGRLGQQKQEYSDGDGPWLVGNRLTYADISFIPWQWVIIQTLEKHEYDQTSFPLVQAWYGKITSRPLVKNVFERAQQSFER